MARPRAEAANGAYRTKATLAKAHIQELIVSGGVAAGGHITTRAVSEALSMSETPVREAMRSLAAEGWLDLHPHLGAVVAGVQAAALTEVYALRGRLGALAIELGGPFYGRHRLAEMAANIRRSAKAVAAGQITAYIQLNRAFHILLCDTAETRWTSRLLTMLWAQTAAMGGGFRLVPARLAESHAEHQAMLAAIEAGAFHDAAELMIEHERRAGSALIAALSAPSER